VRDGKENAGKVSSFNGDMLTITLADGSKMSGKVTDATRVSCSNRSNHDEREVESDTETVHHRRGRDSATAEAAKNDPQPVGGGGSGSPSTDPAPATNPAPATEPGQHGGNGNENETETEHADGHETEHSDDDETEHTGDSGRHRGPGRSGNCAATQLTAGTVVHGARVAITSDGAIFEEVEVLK
ncbi:MAG TPA: hypothetical protein VGJ70_21185, partial [Solirubrobacteraceae bacterium]